MTEVRSKKLDNKIDKIPPYSFVLCIMVMIIHNPVKAYYDFGNSLIADFFHYILVYILPAVTDIAVPSFFIISAYLFYRNYNYSKTTEKLKSRIKTLLIPYLFWNIVALVIAMVTKISGLSHFSVDSSNPFSIKSIIQGVFLYKYNVFWFVFALMLYNALCVVFYTLLKNKLSFMIVIIAEFIIYGVFLKDIYSFCGSYYQWDSLIFYTIGAYLGIHYKNILNFRFKERYAQIAVILWGGGSDY